MKNKILITSLSVRFPLNQGWTLELLKPYVKSGGLVLRGYGDDELDDPYLLPEVGTVIDYEKLLTEKNIEVYGKELWHETKDVSDLAALEMRNW